MIQRTTILRDFILQFRNSTLVNFLNFHGCIPLKWITMSPLSLVIDSEAFVNSQFTIIICLEL